jgi:hypothetical protein
MSTTSSPGAPIFWIIALLFFGTGFFVCMKDHIFDKWLCKPKEASKAKGAAQGPADQRMVQLHADDETPELRPTSEEVASQWGQGFKHFAKRVRVSATPKSPLRQPLILAGGAGGAGPARFNNTANMDIDHSTIARFLEQGTFDRTQIG